jgi:hypothetical protein
MHVCVCLGRLGKPLAELAVAVSDGHNLADVAADVCALASLAAPMRARRYEAGVLSVQRPKLSFTLGPPLTQHSNSVTHTHTHTRIHTHIHTHTYIHTHTCACTHTLSLSLPLSFTEELRVRTQTHIAPKCVCVRA